MNKALARRQHLPPPHVVFAPANLLSNWTPVSRPHPNLQHVRKNAVTLMTAYRKMAEWSFDAIKFKIMPEQDLRAREQLEAILQGVRVSLETMNGDGAIARIVERDIAMHLPILAPEYFRLKEKASSRYQEWKTVLGFLLESDDDDGFDLIPPPPPPTGRSAPTVELVL